jgi:hypothetical protein
MPTPTIYSIAQGAQRGVADVSQVWTQSNGEIPAGLSQFVTVPWKGGVLLVGATAAGKLSLFQLSDAAPFVTPLPQQPELGMPIDLLTSFTLGGVTYLLGYQSKKGDLRFVALNDDLTLTTPYDYSRTRPPAVTPGWTTLQAVAYLSKVYLVAYDKEDGAVDLFSVVATTASAASTPLEVDNVWDWKWAKGWTRFAFFQLGGENYFLKTNLAKLNVNIDHLSLDPNIRSNEVLTWAQNALPNAATLEIVASFYLGDGEPGFLAYQANQPILLYSIWPNCQGWTQQAQLPATSGLSQIVTYQLNDSTFALFY